MTTESLAGWGDMTSKPGDLEIAIVIGPRHVQLQYKVLLKAASRSAGLASQLNAHGELITRQCMFTSKIPLLQCSVSSTYPSARPFFVDTLKRFDLARLRYSSNTILA